MSDTYLKEKLFNDTLKEIKKLWTEYDDLSNFVKWPKNLIYVKNNKNKIEVTDKLLAWKSDNNSKINKIHNLISNLSPYVKWESGYNEKDINKEFLNKYGFFELIGPTGHFKTSKMALYVNFLDDNVCYPWHNHEAEELYFIVSGEAKFESKDNETKILSSTNTRYHESYKPHQITTTNNKILSFVIWKDKFQKVSEILKYK